MFRGDEVQLAREFRAAYPRAPDLDILLISRTVWESKLSEISDFTIREVRPRQYNLLLATRRSSTDSIGFVLPYHHRASREREGIRMANRRHCL